MEGGRLALASKPSNPGTQLLVVQVLYLAGPRGGVSSGLSRVPLRYYESKGN